MNDDAAAICLVSQENRLRREAGGHQERRGVVSKHFSGAMTS